jgi:hypothetical protein
VTSGVVVVVAGESMWTLVLMLVLNNFPQAMVPAFHTRRAACLFFFLYYVLATLFFLNLILATVFNTYHHQTDRARKRAEENRRVGAWVRLLTTEVPAVRGPGGGDRRDLWIFWVVPTSRG